MPLQNATITTEELSGTEGSVSASGIVNLTITPDLGYTTINSDGSINAWVGSATEVNPNEWVGGNVTAGVEKVIFSDNGNNTVNVAVYYAAIDWDYATDLYVDIDGKANQIRVDENDPDLEDGETQSECCDNFEGIISEVVNASSSGTNDGTIQATGNGGSNQYTYSVYQDGVMQNPFALFAGTYSVVITDNNCPCEDVIEVEIMEPNSSTINTISVGTRGFKDEILPIANSQPVMIQHDRDVSFELEVVDPGGRGWYDFNRNTFSSKKSNITIEANGSRITRKTIHFPSVSSAARYQIYINPLGKTELKDSIPTKENPKYIHQRVNSVITLTLSSSDSEWGSFTTATLSGRPNTKPGIKDTAFTNIDFSITSVVTLGGKSAALTSGISTKGAVLKSISNPVREGIILSRDNVPTKIKDGFVPNYMNFKNLNATYVGTTLTVSGKISIEQFGSLSETISINLDNFMTLA